MSALGGRPTVEKATTREGSGTTAVSRSVDGSPQTPEAPLASLRWGVLGAARIAESALADPAREAGHRLVAVAARDPRRAEQWARAQGVERVVDSYEALVADPEVDIVYNPLVNSLHAPWNVAALEAGKHVLSEKPFAANGAQARRVAERARASDRLVMEAYHYAMHPLLQRLQEVLLSDEIGDLRSLSCTTVIPAPAPDDPRWSLDLAGGAVMDVGCYALHVCRQVARWCGGDVAVVAARATQRSGPDRRPTGVDERVRAQVEVAGAPGELLMSMDAEAMSFSLTLVGSRGEVTAPSFVLPHLDDTVRVRTAAGVREERVGAQTSYAHQVRAVARAVQGLGPPPLSLEDAVATMDLVDATYRAAGMDPRPGD